MTESKLITKIVYLSLCSLGILRNPIHAIIYSIILTTVMTFSVAGSIVGFFTTTGTANTLESVSALSPQLATLLIYVDIFSSRKLIKALLRKIKGDEEYAENVIERSDVLVKKKLIWFFIVLALLSTCFIVPPLFISFYDATITDKFSFAIPFWYSCGDRPINVVLKSVCVNVDSKTKLLLANVIMCASLVIMFMVHCSVFNVYRVIVAELTVHLHYLEAKVMTFIDNDEDFACRLISRKKIIYSQMVKRNQKVYDDFVKLIKYQQFIRR